MTTARRLAALALLLAAVPAGAAGAAPAPDTDTRFFRLELKGKQVTTWSQHSEPTSRCDQGVTGSGREVAKFRTPRSFRMQVRRFGDYVIFGDEYGSHVGVTAKVKRTGSQVLTPFDPTCQGTGGGGVATPDCGTKNGSSRIGFEWSSSRKGIGLINDPNVSDWFKTCPLIGTRFPDLQNTDTRLKHIVARIPMADLFDRSIGKHIVIGQGKRTVDTGDSGWTTKIRYEITLEHTK